MINLIKVQDSEKNSGSQVVLCQELVKFGELLTKLPPVDIFSNVSSNSFHFL